MTKKNKKQKKTENKSVIYDKTTRTCAVFCIIGCCHKQALHFQVKEKGNLQLTSSDKKDSYVRKDGRENEAGHRTGVILQTCGSKCKELTHISKIMRK